MGSRGGDSMNLQLDRLLDALSEASNICYETPVSRRDYKGTRSRDSIGKKIDEAIILVETWKERVEDASCDDTDGFYFSPRNTQWQTGTQGSEAAPEKSESTPEIDLSTFALWIDPQPIATHAGLLELIANSLYRHKHYPTLADKIKSVAKDLLALTRHEDEPQ
jgi:hypothetical protein